MQSETGFPTSYQLKSYVASKSRLKLAARAVLSADAGLLVTQCYVWWADGWSDRQIDTGELLLLFYIFIITFVWSSA